MSFSPLDPDNPENPENLDSTEETPQNSGFARVTAISGTRNTFSRGTSGVSSGRVLGA